MGYGISSIQASCDRLCYLEALAFAEQRGAILIPAQCNLITDRRCLNLLKPYQEANAVLYVDEDLLAVAKKRGRSNGTGNAIWKTII